MSATIRTFRNVRARLNRAVDGTWLAGWVTHLARDEARIRLWNYVPLRTEERIAGECYGQGTVARFNGTVVAQAGQDIAISLAGSISYSPSEEAPRIYTAGLMGSLETTEGKVEVQVLDVSPLSLGVLTDRAYPIGHDLNLDLPTEMGPVTARVSVANCRPDPDSDEHHRVGLHIVEMARLDRARWGRLVVERAEA